MMSVTKGSIKNYLLSFNSLTICDISNTYLYKLDACSIIFL
jgi:hypothetical protein